MARFVLRDSIPSKLLLIAACALACLYIQAPVAMAQRAGGGRHPIGGAHMASPPRMVVPPPARRSVSHPRFVGGPHAAPLGARFALRPGRNNLFRRRFFFGASFFRFGPPFTFNVFWSQNCNPEWVWDYYCNGLPFYGSGYGFENYVTVQPYQAPMSASAMRDLVWLYLKDGSAFSVTDYWFVNSDVHFIAMDAGGAKSAEQTIPMGDLDVQKTIQVNSRRGFRIVNRDQPLEQYMHDHPDLTPPLLEPSPRN
ncbi:MAG TPA: hypothetical protein VGI16_13310 [Candidatus Acidoferrum sp.]|jgi:hypothetical protein